MGRVTHPWYCQFLYNDQYCLFQIYTYLQVLKIPILQKKETELKYKYLIW